MKKLILVSSLFLASAAFAAHQGFTGAKPSVSSCGLGATILGNDSIEVISTGTGLVLACTVTFAEAWNGMPICLIMGGPSAINLGISSISATAMVIDIALSLASGKIYYQCGEAQ